MPKRLQELFEIGPGHNLDLLNLQATTADDPEGVAYISRSARNNGVLAFVKQDPDITPAAMGSLTLSVGGSVCATFLQPRSYYTAQNVRVLTPYANMSNQEKLWWALCIWHNRYRYNYGRHANSTFRDLKLPDAPPPGVLATKFPDYSRLPASADGGPLYSLDVTKWQVVKLGAVFEIKRGRYVPAAQKLSGDTPEVSSTSGSNGVARYISLPAEHPAGSISVARNGSVGEAFVQNMPFFATDDVHVLYPNQEVSKEALLFVCALIRRERYRFNYGRKWSVKGMREAELRLPTHDGEVDWSVMEAYIRRLPFSAHL
jgi:Type I restriction modification DNA specificity domain